LLVTLTHPCLPKMNTTETRMGRDEETQTELGTHMIMKSAICKIPKGVK
jgi:hypothetical protein